MSIDEQNILAALTSVECFLDERAHSVDGYRRVASALARMPDALRRDPDAELVIGIDSDLDRFPSEKARSRWGRANLDRLDAELAVYLGRVHEEVETSLSRLRAKLRRELMQSPSGEAAD